MKRIALGLLSLSFFACAAPSPEPVSGPSASEAAISDAKVKLPAGDACRDVLAPLALGLAESAVGLEYAKSITVSLTSETDTRLYIVSAVADSYAATFEVELDNDSASKCFLLSATMNDEAKLANDTKTKMKHGEASFAATIALEPADDDCGDAVKLIADAVGVADVGRASLTYSSVKFLGEDENRYYRIHVAGRPITVDGHTVIANEYDYDLETSNDSASKCWVQELRRTPSVPK